ncbi:hypothetical protein SISNIDRAFT_481734 [Sistotremastrum niveocremeum HHB9708]|uniref:Btz domain-containing protein n=1 Tax=Sistotremastrum niveocremeum HHB9708 TaxID=1314777 RepID=A0A164ZM54_9AGAM|nr:hypothetical protein SISNIDRAFT_481734 [Sistotremastrum niveocremeum HHB9708]
MPAPTLTIPSSSKVDSSVQSPSSAKTPASRSKAKLRARRRRRASESDDEQIERDLSSDSESGDLSFHSASESGSDEEEENFESPNGLDHGSPLLRPATPAEDLSSTSHSQLNEVVDQKTNGHSFFAPEHANWSDMVTDENANGPTDLPVIDFADFTQGGHTAADATTSDATALAPPPKILTPPPRTTAPVAPSDDARATNSGPAPPRRTDGKSVRQNYQQRLQEDPSFVPVVGMFWGHDDRLMNKDLRSMSNWWRGKWGRGGGGGANWQNRSGNTKGSRNGQGATNSEDGWVPPASEQAWTHDGFEQMRQRDEQRAVQTRGRRPQGPSAPSGSRGRGGPQSPVHNNRAALNSTAHAQAVAQAQGRPWFVRKPEKPWTQQFDAFLHFDHDLRPRPGQGQGVRIHLNSKSSSIVRLPQSTTSPNATHTPSSSSPTRSESERLFVVRLPKRKGATVAQTLNSRVPPATPVVPEPITTVADPFVDDEPSTSYSAPPSSLPVDDSRGLQAVTEGVSQLGLQTASPAALQTSTAIPTVSAGLEEKLPPAFVPSSSTAGIESSTGMAAADPSAPAIGSIPSFDPALNAQPSVLPPAQIPTASPPLYPPGMAYQPQYTYHPGFPPGVVLDESGYPVDQMTGQYVYLQPSLQVPSIYNPPPLHMMSSPESLMYGHMMADYMPSSPFGDHQQPVQFSLPRQRTRVEIRAPSGEESGVGKRVQQQTSGPRLGSQPAVTDPAYSPAAGYAGVNGETMPTGERLPNGSVSYGGMQYYFPTYPYAQYPGYDGYSDGTQPQLPPPPQSYY